MGEFCRPLFCYGMSEFCFSADTNMLFLTLRCGIVPPQVKDSLIRGLLLIHPFTINTMTLLLRLLLLSHGFQPWCTLTCVQDLFLKFRISWGGNGTSVNTTSVRIGYINWKGCPMSNEVPPSGLLFLMWRSVSVEHVFDLHECCRWCACSGSVSHLVGSVFFSFWHFPALLSALAERCHLLVKWCSSAASLLSRMENLTPLHQDGRICAALNAFVC